MNPESNEAAPKEPRSGFPLIEALEPTSETRPVAIHVSEAMREEVNLAAVYHGISASKYIEMAATFYLEKPEEFPGWLLDEDGHPAALSWLTSQKTRVEVSKLAKKIDFTLSEWLRTAICEQLRRDGDHFDEDFYKKVKEILEKRKTLNEPKPKATQPSLNEPPQTGSETQ